MDNIFIFIYLYMYITLYKALKWHNYPNKKKIKELKQLHKMNTKKWFMFICLLSQWSLQNIAQSRKMQLLLWQFLLFNKMEKWSSSKKVICFLKSNCRDLFFFIDLFKCCVIFCDKKVLFCSDAKIYWWISKHYWLLLSL